MPKTEYPQFRECLQNCEFVGLTQTLDQGRSIIPAPRYPKAEAKKEEFHSRYGWLDEQLSDGGLRRNVPEVTFDDHPNSDGRLQDHQLFGESYLVVWLCPYDLTRVCKHFCQIAAEVMRFPESSSSFRRFRLEEYSTYPDYNSPQQHNQDAAKYLKRELINRLCLLEPVKEQEIAEIKGELAKALSAQID